MLIGCALLLLRGKIYLRLKRNVCKSYVTSAIFIDVRNGASELKLDGSKE